MLNSRRESPLTQSKCHFTFIIRVITVVTRIPIPSTIRHFQCLTSARLTCTNKFKLQLLLSHITVRKRMELPFMDYQLKKVLPVTFPSLINTNILLYQRKQREQHIAYEIFCAESLWLPLLIKQFLNSKGITLLLYGKMLSFHLSTNYVRRALFYFGRAVYISVQTVIGSRWFVVCLSNHNKKCACKAVSILHSVFRGTSPAVCASKAFSTNREFIIMYMKYYTFVESFQAPSTCKDIYGEYLSWVASLSCPQFAY